MRFVVWFSTGLLLVCCSQALAVTPYDGVFLGDDGNGNTKLYTVTSQDSQVTIADLSGTVINAMIDDNNAFLHANGEPIEVITTDDFVIGAVGIPSARLTRVFGTDNSFPLANEPGPYVPQPLLAGNWDIQERSLDLETGEQLRFGDGSLLFRDVFSLEIRNGGVRFIDSQNIWFQGAMRTGDELTFFAINNAAARAAGTPQTLAPSENNFQRDVLGSGRFLGPNRFEVTLVLQTLDQTPNPQQFLLQIIGQRLNALATGDVDGDGNVAMQDRELIAEQFGLNPQDASYNLAADINDDRIVDRRDIDRLDNTEVPRQTVGPWMSGLWLDPDRSGEGFHLSVTDAQSAVIAWFTYRPDGGQAWVVGTGTIENGELFFDQMQITSGASFGADFDPASVVRESWGRLRIFFDDCDNGWMSWSGRDDFRNGGYPMARLTQPLGLDCDSQSVDDASGLGLYTGIWFDSQQSGAGWFVDQLADQGAAVTWFTYDDQGNQQWMVGVGTIGADGLLVEQLDETSGARFGANFSAADVVRSRWGTLTLQSECESGSLSYSGDSTRFGNGQQTIVPLARLAGQRC